MSCNGTVSNTCDIGSYAPNCNFDIFMTTNGLSYTGQDIQFFVFRSDPRTTDIHSVVDWPYPYPTFMCKSPQFISRFSLRSSGGGCNEIGLVDPDANQLQFELWSGIDVDLENLYSTEGIAWARAYCHTSNPICQAIKTGTPDQQKQAILKTVCESNLGCQSLSSDCPCAPPQSMNTLLPGFVKPAGKKLANVTVKKGEAGIFIITGNSASYSVSTFAGNSNLANTICSNEGIPILPVKPKKPFRPNKPSGSGSSSSHHTLSKGAIAGIVAGGVVLIAIIIIIVIMYHKKGRFHQNKVLQGK